jgi:hypothetical protein
MPTCASESSTARDWNGYCAIAPVRRLHWSVIDSEHLVYESIKPGPGGSVSLLLTPLELLDRRAALIPPPCQHRHRYYGVLAANSHLRAAVTKLSAADSPDVAAPDPPAADVEVGSEPAHRKTAHYVWAMLLVRI